MNYTSILINTLVHTIILMICEGITLFIVFYPIINSELTWATDNLSWNLLYKFIWPNIKWSNCNTPNNKPQDLTPYYITPLEYNLLQISEKKEQNYINSIQNNPYIAYSLILSTLVILLIIIIIFSRYTNIDINYKVIMISSFITIILFAGIAGTIVIYDEVLQVYEYNILSAILEKILEKYKSLL